MWPMEDYPRVLREFEARFSTERACAECVPVALARGVCLSGLWSPRGMGHREWPGDLHGLPESNDGNGRDDTQGVVTSMPYPI